MTKKIGSLLFLLFVITGSTTAFAGGPFRVFATEDNKLAFDDLRKNNIAKSRGQKHRYDFCPSNAYLYFLDMQTVPIVKCHMKESVTDIDSFVFNVHVLFYVKDERIIAQTKQGIMSCDKTSSILFPSMECVLDEAGNCVKIIYNPIPVCLPDKPKYIQNK